MRSIRIDDEVYAWLEKQAVGFDDPNSVLRRLAGLPAKAEPPAENGKDGEDGKLLPLIKAGSLKAGATLTWHRPRKNEIHYATVTDNGCIRLADGRLFTDPSPAAVALAGHQNNGWNVWEVNGVKLKDLK
ncbi:hypothetical protein AB0J52_00165 [Spirillospora sp. NPDC049652]